MVFAKPSATYPANPWPALLVAASGPAVAVLGMIGVQPGLPNIAVDLDTSVSEAQWIVISYGLTQTALVPLGGRLSDVFDRKDTFLGGVLMFIIGSLFASQVASVDVPGVTHYATTPDTSQIPLVLTQQIPIVAPVRERVVEFGRSGTGDSRGENGQCVPDCEEFASFPWTIRINGASAHSMNANRISLLIPKPGEVEHWTYVNGGGGWEHPIHLHFEEGVTINRGDNPIPATERLVRKDVWRLRPGGSVKFQVQFGEFAGSYVNHCHNTVHEDFAMIMRIQILSGITGSPQAVLTATPNPTPDGVVWTTPEILPEGDPRPQQTALR